VPSVDGECHLLMAGDFYLLVISQIVPVLISQTLTSLQIDKACMHAFNSTSLQLYIKLLNLLIVIFFWVGYMYKLVGPSHDS
jgi:hypothetical protein